MITIMKPQKKHDVEVYVIGKTDFFLVFIDDSHGKPVKAVLNERGFRVATLQETVKACGDPDFVWHMNRRMHRTTDMGGFVPVINSTAIPVLAVKMPGRTNVVQFSRLVR